MSEHPLLAQQPSRICFAGEWHGNRDFAGGRDMSAAARWADVLLHLGDFGFWHGHEGKAYIDILERVCARKSLPVLWIDGNLEDHDLLAELPREYGLGKVSDHIWHFPRGTGWEWGGLRFGGLGGAASVDRQLRSPGKDWWPQEELTSVDLSRWITGEGLLDSCGRGTQVGVWDFAMMTLVARLGLCSIGCLWPKPCFSIRCRECGRVGSSGTCSTSKPSFRTVASRTSLRWRPPRPRRTARTTPSTGISAASSATVWASSPSFCHVCRAGGRWRDQACRSGDAVRICRARRCVRFLQEGACERGPRRRNQVRHVGSGMRQERAHPDGNPEMGLEVAPENLLPASADLTLCVAASR